MKILLIVLIAAALTGVLVTSLEVLLTLRYGRRRSCARFSDGAPESSPGPRPGAAPSVSILKPLCGLDDGLRENLDSFAALGGVSYEVILSIAGEDDPAVQVALEVMRRNPDGPFRLIVDQRDPRVRNPKIERLIAAERLARGEIILVSDSNVRCEPEDLSETVRALSKPVVGCATNPFVGKGGRNLGARIEMLHLLSFVLPGIILAKACGRVCVVGKSMALRRDVLDRIGGFRRFGDFLAEDQAIALAVRELGYEIAVVPVIVTNIVISRSLRQALGRQIRWNKIRYAFSPVLYSGELLLMPFPISLLALIIAAAGAPSVAWPCACFAALVAAARVLQVEILHRATDAERPSGGSLLLLLLDLLQFSVHWTPYFSRQIDWRGKRARIERGTVILPVKTSN